MINALLCVIDPNHSWGMRLFTLLNQYPQINPKRMGFPENWYDDPFWKRDISWGTGGALSHKSSQEWPQVTTHKIR